MVAGEAGKLRTKCRLVCSRRLERHSLKNRLRLGLGVDAFEFLQVKVASAGLKMIATFSSLVVSALAVKLYEPVRMMRRSIRMAL